MYLETYLSNTPNAVDQIQIHGLQFDQIQIRHLYLYLQIQIRIGGGGGSLDCISDRDAQRSPLTRNAAKMGIESILPNFDKTQRAHDAIITSL